MRAIDGALPAETPAKRFSKTVESRGAAPVKTISSGVRPFAKGVAPTAMPASAWRTSRFKEVSPEKALAAMFVTVVALSHPPSVSPSMFFNRESSFARTLRMDGSARWPRQRMCDSEALPDQAKASLWIFVTPPRFHQLNDDFPTAFVHRM